jgi:GxxExxY protein
MLHSDVTGKILRAYYNVYNELGFGFLEKNYERAMLIELRKMGVASKAQEPITVYYDGEQIGTYFADLVVEEKVIVELKAATCLAPENEVQLLNYLRATKMEVGMLLNFGTQPEFKRRVFANNRKSD